MGCLGSDKVSIKKGGDKHIEKEGVMECKDMVIVMRAVIIIRMIGEGVSIIRGVRFIEEADVIVSKGEVIVGKVVINFLGAMIVLETFMVGKDVDNELGTKEKVTSVF